MMSGVCGLSHMELGKEILQNVKLQAKKINKPVINMRSRFFSLIVLQNMFMQRFTRCMVHNAFNLLRY